MACSARIYKAQEVDKESKITTWQTRETGKKKEIPSPAETPRRNSEHHYHRHRTAKPSQDVNGFAKRISTLWIVFSETRSTLKQMRQFAEQTHVVTNWVSSLHGQQ
jgi:hypothetical protein